jgi:regulator of sigma E protease
VEDLAFQFIAAIDLFAATDLGAILTKFLNILSVVLGLGLVIFFHELGHFAVAKWCDVHVERFSIGIGPILWSRQKGETEYALSALPFGGYVKMLGQDDMDPNQMTSSEIAENPRSYSAKTVPQRMAIISAGVIMNVVTGFMFFATCYWFGVFEPAPVVGSVITGFPAWQADIRPGDRILSVNGESIRSFSDLQEAVILSAGDVTLAGTHADGTSFNHILTPLQSSSVRSVGIRPGAIAQIADQIEKPDLISDAGLPLERASGDFLPGDKILDIIPKLKEGESAPATTNAATGSDSKSMQFSLLRYMSSRYADSELIYKVERTEKTSDAEKAGATKIVEITVPPSEIRSIGLWMAMGPVLAVQKDSVAEKAGIKVRDIIVSVDDQEPGKTIDPLQLPVYFGDRGGKPVKVVVKRATPNGDEQVELELIPKSDEPGWLDSPDFKASPLSIPSLGLGYQVQPRIAKILEGSEAEKLGVFKPDMKITRIDLIHSDPTSDAPDALGDAKTPKELDLATLDAKEPGTLEQINWAWAFAVIQRVPNRQIRIYFDDGKNNGSEVLKTHEVATGWYRWFRGFNGSIWQDDRELQKGKTFGEAMSLGGGKIRKTANSIYLTLHSLLRGRVSLDSMSGPVGIAKIGYMVAERGLIDLMMFLGYLSINLAILNFLPIPILDGGHMVFLFWEGITRRKPSSRVIGWAHGFGLLFIISLFLFVMYVDLSSLIGGGD